MSATTTPSAERHVVVVVDGDFPGAGHPEARRVIDAVSGGHTLLVAPAGPVPGERWVVDLSARAEQARRRLDGWSSALTPHALTVDVEIGDASPILAAADARHAFSADTVVATHTAKPAEARPRGWASAFARLSGVKPRPTVPALGVG